MTTIATPLTDEQIEELKAIRRLYLKGIQIVPNEAKKTYFQGSDGIVATCCCYFGAVMIGALETDRIEALDGNLAASKGESVLDRFEILAFRPAPEKDDSTVFGLVARTNDDESRAAADQLVARWIEDRAITL